ncbi:hypothetical protein O6H91_10G005200 [Diphasiastrum complanatum]|uniref:Uncharacterized protein n=1 Tax=Diphasiastrum complanatum TaxID=34168 RepID=A0ACC2CDV6_DIPCM|nr:hypothetical protein O6H91_10G005200 [Diphasiastrum complanatum]
MSRLLVLWSSSLPLCMQCVRNRKHTCDLRKGRFERKEENLRFRRNRKLHSTWFETLPRSNFWVKFLPPCSKIKFQPTLLIFSVFTAARNLFTNKLINCSDICS